MRFPTRLASPALCLAALVSSGCGEPQPSPPPTTEAPASEGDTGNFRGRVYERNFVFTTVAGDSAFIVPWFTTARTRPGTVQREARGWLQRSGAWEGFYAERWETPATRIPWRILPHGSLRLVVGEADAVLGILFDEGPRQLELTMGDVLMEWTGPRGESFRLLDAAVFISEQRVDGMAMDMARAHATDEPRPGDWAFLVSGDSLQVVLESPEQSEPGAEGGFRAWGRLDFRDLQWPEVTVLWSDVRAFQPARQDVPVAWAVATPDGDLEGSLEVRSAEIRAGDGDGPVLPVDALFEVGGTLTVEGAEYPVRGLFRHTR